MYASYEYKVLVPIILILIVYRYITDIFRVENDLYSPCSNLEGIETRLSC